MGMTPTRQHLLGLLPVEIRLGYYIDSDDGQPDPTHVYCSEHARAVAKRWGKARGIEAYACSCWGGSDNVEHCAIATCGVALDCGSLTDYGVDSALALTEEDPFACSVTPAELTFSAEAMGKDDPRWPVWDRHLLATLRRAPWR